MQPKHRFRKNGQDRRGNPRTRWLEYSVVLDQVKRRREAFIARLQRNLRNVGKCIVATGTADHGGYPRMNFKYKGRHISIHIMRVIAILRNCAPIPAGFEVAHTHPRECSRACVYHTELEHYTINAATNIGGRGSAMNGVGRAMTEWQEGPPF